MIIAVFAYIILLAFGIKSTWGFIVNYILPGSCDIAFTIIIFVLVILIAGPIFGTINLVKFLIHKYKESRINKS
jgi:hypothetical protein